MIDIKFDYLHVDKWTAKQVSSTNSSLQLEHLLGSGYCSGWLANDWLDKCFCPLKWLIIPLGLVILIPQHIVGTNFCLTDWLVIDVEATDWLTEESRQLLRWLPKCWLMSNCLPHSHVKPAIVFSPRCLQESWQIFIFRENCDLVISSPIFGAKWDP